MSVYLFRAKNNHTGEWVYGSLIEKYDFIITEDSEIVPIILNTAGQYIGVNDIDSNKIFEGDKLEFWSKIENDTFPTYVLKGVVVYDIDFATYVIASIKNNKIYSFEKEGYIYKVVGNVYDDYEEGR